MLIGIFTKKIPINILYLLLEKVGIKKDKYYLFNYNCFRIMMYHKYNEEFIQSLYEYYNPSKRHYLTRPTTYNSFITIIRQICKLNDVEFKTKIMYQHSIYHIEYLIASS
jgi:hypothetical protein